MYLQVYSSALLAVIARPPRNHSAIHATAIQGNFSYNSRLLLANTSSDAPKLYIWTKGCVYSARVDLPCHVRPPNWRPVVCSTAATLWLLLVVLGAKYRAQCGSATLAVTIANMIDRSIDQSINQSINQLVATYSLSISVQDRQIQSPATCHSSPATTSTRLISTCLVASYCCHLRWGKASHSLALLSSSLQKQKNKTTQQTDEREGERERERERSRACELVSISVYPFFSPPSPSPYSHSHC